MLVAKEVVAREGVGGGQRSRHRQQRVDDDVFDRRDVAVVPGRIGEDDPVVVEREVVRPQREAAEDLVGRLERHVQEPIERQQQEDDIDRRDQGARAHRHLDSFRIISV
jgi:hypothetical protein